MVSIHPLVFLNLTDHYVRNATNITNKPQLGLLMGSVIANTLNQRDENSGIIADSIDTELDVVNSFDIVFTESGEIDWGYLEKRVQQQGIILPNEIVLGVYEVTRSQSLEPSPYLQEFRSQLSNSYGNELISLVFNPSLLQDEDRPSEFFKVYLGDGTSVNKHGNEIKTKDAEKVGVDTILTLREDSQGDEIKKFEEFYKVNKSFLMELNKRVELILTSLKDIKDYELLRDINSLVAKLNYKHDDDLVLNLISLENNLKFYMEVVMSLQNLKSLDDLKSRISLVKV